ncbi:MAG: class I SAM-dependent methyltransferase [Candidatus Bathyarchaeia archaeon]
MRDGKCWRIKRKVIRHYDRLAKIYNALYGYEQNLKIKEALKVLDVKALDLVLDVGCGTGLLFKHIFSSSSLIVGIDISSRTLRVAKNLVKNLDSNQIALVRADADFLPFRNNIFDKIFAITLLQNMPNPISTLSEIARVAKDSSEIVITGLKKFFSRREDFLRILRESGMCFFLMNSEEDVKCHIAICSKNRENLGKSINNGKRIKMVT